MGRLSDRILSEDEKDEMLRLNVNYTDSVIDKRSCSPHPAFNGSIELTQNDPEIKYLIELLIKYGIGFTASSV